jgi:hypothetical protein
MEVHAVSESYQLDLFLSEEETKTDKHVDISDIDIDFGDANHMAKLKSNACKRFKNLPKGKYLICREDKEEDLPYIKNTHSGKKLKVRSSRSQYPCVDLVGNGESMTQSIHQIIGMAFIHNLLPKDRTHIDHVDGDKNNYAVENLRWTTPSENQSNKHFKKINTELELNL